MPSNSVGTTGIQLVPQNPNRVSLYVENQHATAVLYIQRCKKTEIETGTADITIPAKQWKAVKRNEDGIIVTDEWAIVSDTASTTYNFVEGTDTPEAIKKRYGPEAGG